MWEIFTVRRPFEVMLPSVIRESVLRNKRPDLMIIPPEVPETISELIGRCWEQTAANRPNFCEIKTAIETEINIRRRKSVLCIEKQEDAISGKDEQLPNNIQLFEIKDLTLISGLGDDMILANYNGDESNRLVVVKHPSRKTGNAEHDLMTEVGIISKLCHNHIIEFIGIYYSEIKFLVMEYASMGPMDALLQNHPTFSIKNILKCMYQVATGMAYLETKRIIHCCLAAKNIFLVSEQLAEISNFSYSKLLQPKQTYCLIASNEFKEHLKWVAPETRHTNYISSKSDSWSFGITLWEALSYGSVPYYGMTDDQICNLIEDGKRLKKPVYCSQELYRLMHRCWQSDAEMRPAFQDIVDAVHELLSEVDVLSRLDSNNHQSCSNINIRATDTNLKEPMIQQINVKDLNLIDTITNGEFMKSRIYCLGKQLVFAIEITGDDETPNMDIKTNALRCAKIIRKLHHDFIIPLIGICNTECTFMFITEYAFVGRIDDFLRNHTNTPIENIIKLMYQVAQGMAFLEKNRIIHCSISAKHILLVSEHHAKISSSTYCEELDLKESNCKKDLTHDKSLVRRMAPESLTANEFSSKSDVWSFGILLWECLSYGKEPFYGSEDVREIKKWNSRSFSMDKPEKCPEHLYFLMLECWCQVPEYRPTFRKIVWTFETIFRRIKMHSFLLDSKSGLDNIFIIESSQLVSTQDIGMGCFGHNYIGTCKVDDKVYPSFIETADKSNIVLAMASFTKEMLILSKLRNPYLVRPFGMCVGKEYVALIMRSSEIGSLCHVIDHQTLPLITLIRCMYQVAQGMAYLHENRILHLNLGTSCVYLRSEDHATIGNFEMSAKLNYKEKYVWTINSLNHSYKVEWSAPECFEMKKAMKDMMYGALVQHYGKCCHHMTSSFLKK